MNCKGKIINLDEPIVMGILNATPDSFYNKGRHSSLHDLSIRAIEMIGEGATILDIGGQSSRPNAHPVSLDEELKRVIPVIEAIHSKFPSTVLSIDTYRSEVAKKCIEAGVDMINDISGGELDAKMIDVAATSKAAYICMHMQGTPQTMQQNPYYENVCLEIYNFFFQKIKFLHEKGLENVMIDVGFGFGKSLEDNYEILRNLSYFLSLNKPLVVGISRKSMVYKPIDANAENALNGTTALHMVALQNGAKILRVHDVKEAKECIELYKMVQKVRKTDS